MINQNSLNRVSRLAFEEFKKMGKSGYKEKKMENPLATFKGFEPSLGNIFTR